MISTDDTLNSASFTNGSNNEVPIKNCFRLVILGAPRVGKSCIINWFLGKDIKDSYIPTIEDFHRKIYKIRGEMFRLDILDTSGNDPFPAMKKLNIMTGDLFVIVFSIDDIDSYLQVKQLCELIIELKKTKQDSKHHNTNVPILIIGNKLDYLLENKILQRCVDLSEMQQFASSLKSSIFCEISCKNLMGLDNAFEKLFTQANLPVEMIPSKHRRISLNLDLSKPQNGRCLQPLNGLADSAFTAFTNISGNPVKNNSLRFQKDSPTNHSNHLSTVEREGSFKLQAKKSFRKMTFRRQLTEACGAVWINARRPSIKSELKLLQVKSNRNFIYRQNKNVDKRGNQASKTNTINNNSALFYVRKNQAYDSRINILTQNFKNLFCCHSNNSKSNRNLNRNNNFIDQKYF